MSAFGRKPGVGGMSPGARPQFGVARPMKGGGGTPAPDPARQGGMPQLPMGGQLPGGEQFPPLPGMNDGIPQPSDAQALKADAMTRLSDRANAVTEGPIKMLQ